MVSDCSNIEELCADCSREQQLFHSRKLGTDTDSSACLQLFFCASSEQDSEDAFNCIVEIFHKQVISWILRYRMFAFADESAEWIANLAFFNFYRQLKQDKFRERSQSVAGILQLFKLCVHAAAYEFLPGPDEPIKSTTFDSHEEFSFPVSDNDIDTSLDWLHATKCLTDALADPEDRMLALMTFLYDLKPRHIEELFPDRWKDVRKQVYRIREKLRKDDEYIRCLNNIE